MRMFGAMGLAMAAAMAVVVPVAKADALLFNLSAVNGSTMRGAGSGVGQGVAVSTTTVLDGMAFDVRAAQGANVKYMVYAADDQTLLYSQTMAVAAYGSLQWVEMTGFQYTLQAGQTYFFGMVADNSISVAYLSPQMQYSANGLQALTTGNTNYDGYAAPVASNGGAAQIGLELYGTQVAATPEPGSLVLLGTGAMAAAGVVRRRWTRA